MTYIDLIREADYQVDTNRITLEEYDKMIAPLRRDVDALDKIRDEIKQYQSHLQEGCIVWNELEKCLRIIEKYREVNE